MSKKLESPSSNAAESAKMAGFRVPTNASNRRLHQRVSINSYIVICCQNRQGVQRRIRACAIDSSQSGVLVQTEEPIAAGSEVFLQSAKFSSMGRASVRYCTQKGMKYRLGLYVPDRLVRSV